jgi:hypothetical protein
MISVLTRRGLRSPYRRDFLPDGRPILRKRVGPQHELLKPPGVAVDEPVLDDAERQGFVGIAVHRTRTGEELWALLERWRKGILIRRGFGPQRALRWSDLEPLPVRLGPVRPGEQAAPQAKAAGQVDLFTGVTR